MGYVDAAGNYHKEAPKFNEVVPIKTSVWKQSDHDRQRREHKQDLINPYLPSGEPNPEFIEAYPEESIEQYHFIKSDDDILKEQNNG